MIVFKTGEKRKIKPCITFADLFTTICGQLEKENLYPEDMIDYAKAQDIPEKIGCETVCDNIGIDDVTFHVEYGGSEGIYLDIYCYMDSNRKQELGLGIVKTLEESEEAFRKMAVLGANFVLCLNRYRAENPWLFRSQGVSITEVEPKLGSFSYWVKSISTASQEEIESAINDMSSFRTATVLRIYDYSERTVQEYTRQSL